ncbi:DUF5986 family protein [Clostridium sp. D33t1_170424_F3]|uniref:DUF5986 family protein n=1 Tax=Clostridium sp. D33t1_170424_F3 TaxID=2787099 RepID=UPI0018AB3774|nr:DUF5986 family protein [Clostridium sp. D33t1_170424_F3]
MNKNTLEVDPAIRSIITQCISDAVGDKIREDVRLHGLRTQNSTPTRIWDLLNTDLCRHFNSPDCMAYTSKRGPWEMILVYEKQSGFLYTFMREKRFAEIRAKVGKRRRMHYVDMLVRHLNSDLKAPIEQLSMFPTHFDDEARLAESIQTLLANLLEDGAIVRRHVLVLFESARFVLTSVRAVMVDTNLNIVSEQNWSSSILVEESVIADQVKEPKDPANTPARGLKLTAKATARKESNPLRQVDEKSEEK